MNLEVERGFRPKGVFGKGVGNSQKCVRNASKMRQKCVKMGLVLLGKEERPKCVRNPSKLRQKCVKTARNTFGGEHLFKVLDDTEERGFRGEEAGWGAHGLGGCLGGVSSIFSGPKVPPSCAIKRERPPLG